MSSASFPPGSGSEAPVPSPELARPPAPISGPLVAAPAPRSTANPARIPPRLLAGIGIVVLCLLVFAGWRTGWLLGTGEPEGLLFTIPAGAKERVEQPTIDSAIEIPTRIRFAAGEPAVITVRNLDDVAHRAGPFLVEAYQTYTQRFPEPGDYPIACSVNPLESVVVTVEA
jgi:hypothetical protein